MESLIKDLGIKATYAVPAGLLVGGLIVSYKYNKTQATVHKFWNKNVGEIMILAGLVSFAFLISKND